MRDDSRQRPATAEATAPAFSAHMGAAALAICVEGASASVVGFDAAGMWRMVAATSRLNTVTASAALVGETVSMSLVPLHNADKCNQSSVYCSFRTCAAGTATTALTSAMVAVRPLPFIVVKGALLVKAADVSSAAAVEALYDAVLFEAAVAARALEQSLFSKVLRDELCTAYELDEMADATLTSPACISSVKSLSKPVLAFERTQQPPPPPASQKDEERKDEPEEDSPPLAQPAPRSAALPRVGTCVETLQHAAGGGICSISKSSRPVALLLSRNGAVDGSLGFRVYNFGM